VRQVLVLGLFYICFVVVASERLRSFFFFKLGRGWSDLFFLVFLGRWFVLVEVVDGRGESVWEVPGEDG